MMICHRLYSFARQGKTDVAMLTVLRVIDQHLDRSASLGNMAAAVKRDKFKIIYV